MLQADARGKACTTPLHMAVVNRRVEVVYVLLEHGANEDETSPIAAAKRYNEIMEVPS